MSLPAFFDALADHYDELWTNSPAGQLQREAAWREIAFASGQRVLDLGCGTAEDAVRLARAGVRVYAIDISPRMVEVSRQRTAAEGLADRVTLEVRAIEDLGGVAGCFDGALANFGALNCVPDLRAVAADLGRLIRPGGTLVICVIGRFCLWETLWYLLHAKPRKASRRWRPGATASLGAGEFPVYYPAVRDLDAAFADRFRRVRLRGIGILVPPSYVRLPRFLVHVFAAVDRLAAACPVLRGFGDHRLVVYQRSAGAGATAPDGG